MGDYLPAFHPGHEVTFLAAGPIQAGQLVATAGDRLVQTAQATGPAPLGVAAQDTTTGSDLLVHFGGIQRLAAAEPISAGDAVYPGSDGTAAPTGTEQIGLALTSAAAGQRVQVKMNR